MLKRARQLSKLSSFELRILFIALFLLPMTAFVLQIKGFRWTQSLLNRGLPKNPQHTTPQSLQLKKAQTIARMVIVAANYGPYRANCLKKSLVTRWLLAGQGIETKLRIGVNKDEGKIQAHAWIETQGVQLLNGGVEDNYYKVIF